MTFLISLNQSNDIFNQFGHLFSSSVCSTNDNQLIISVRKKAKKRKKKKVFSHSKIIEISTTKTAFSYIKWGQRILFFFFFFVSRRSIFQLQRMISFVSDIGLYSLVSFKWDSRTLTKFRLCSSEDSVTYRYTNIRN